MHEVASDLVILLAGIWLVAVTLRPLGLPTVMGELIVGVVVGPAVLGIVQPGEAIELLAEIGIFFLMFHAGAETQPQEFYDAIKRSLGVALVGAIVPFSVSFSIATLFFGLDRIGATFVGLTMTATAVVITLTSLKDLGLEDTLVARVIVASCVIDDLLTVVVFGVLLGVLTGGSFEAAAMVTTIGKVIGFFVVLFLVARYVYPRLTLPFRSEGGKGFTFVLLTAVAAGLFAESIGLHMILGAYLAGLFFEERVADASLVRVVKDRAYGIAYSFLGPIFFISLGFEITFDISGSGVGFLLLLTGAVIVGQILSAGSMARQIGMSWRESLTVGVGMCGRAELAFILAALALSEGAIDKPVFSVLIFTCFLLNLFTPLALKGCADLLCGGASHLADATRGVVQIDKFKRRGFDPEEDRVNTLPELEGGVIVYGYGPEVELLLVELENRGVPTLILEEDEERVERLLERGRRVVFTPQAGDGELDMQAISQVRAVVTNTDDDRSGVFVLAARDHGFEGPIVSLIDSPSRRSALMLSGATMAFTPEHILAAALAARASRRMGPLVTGVAPTDAELEIAELRVHRNSPLAGSTLAAAEIGPRTGAHVVGQWRDNELAPPPAPDAELAAGALLVAVGSPDSLQALSEMVLPIPESGPIVVIGHGPVGEKLAQLLGDAEEPVRVVHTDPGPGVDFAGDVYDHEVLEQAGVRAARAVVVTLQTTRASDRATRIATRVLRDHAPDVPILAGLSLLDSVDGVIAAGADYALSLSQVSGQILVRQVLRETLSLQPHLRLAKLAPGRLVGRDPLSEGVREKTGCTVVAIERDGEVTTDLSHSFELREDDAIFVCGSTRALRRLDERYRTSHL